MNRKQRFRKEFEMMCSILHKTPYIINREEIFGSMCDRYFDLSTSLKDEDFAPFFCVFGSKFPNPEEYSRAVSNYVAQRDKEAEKAPSRPPMDASELSYIGLQFGMVKAYWTLMDSDPQKFAQIYLKHADNDRSLVPNYWLSKL
jgi:hypothetical protein